MYVGQPVKRIEDIKFITGGSSYVDDIELPGTLFVAFLRSTKPHAKIKIKKSSSNIFTGIDINPGKDFPIPTDEVTYVGQPIATVVAKDRYEAYDLVESIEVEYEDLDYVIDPEIALNDKIKVYSKNNTNIYEHKTWQAGNVNESFKSADKIIEGELYNQRVIASPIETRGTLAYYDGYRLNIWSSTQSAHYLRRNLINFLGINNIHVIQPDVGGAFGSKIIAHPEEYALAKLALILRKPLKWVPTRTEEMQSAGHGRDKKLKFSVAVKNDGTILGIKGTLIADLGAPYPDANDDEIGNVHSTVRMLPGAYKVSNMLIDHYAVNTNKAPTQSYRGAGRPEATYFIERIINIVAKELNRDEFEIREKNIVRELPYKNAFGITYDSGDYLQILSKGKELYDKLRAEAKPNECVGSSMYVEISGFGPWETARVFAKSDGKVVIVTGSGPHGQGDGTAFAQIAADILEIPLENIEVRWGDTDIIEDGIGTWGSRTVTVGGSAIYKASEELKKRIVEVGAKLLEADIEEVEYKNGNVKHKKNGKSVGIKEIMEKAYSLGYSLDVTYVYSVQKPGYTVPYGVHLALISIDKETGLVKVKKYVAIDDVGRVINPLLAEGQIIGGVVQGMGQAIYEGTVYSSEGVLLNSNLNDYGVPTAVESPRVEWNYIEKGFSNHPTMSKGIGEAGAIASTPAIVNAIEKCIGRRIVKMPVRAEEVL
ncbi:xanthine dehydrogenase family protein molybdopterin-binding subunit [Sulfolobus sp. A20-N-F6]|uniref:glyceraldehyde dehydrogenase subunit alpha n=1 Tax=Saccharolobus sp. A20 TaxID=1891280 RepID=UPI000845E25B|nr:glyceraldehyde dehydrogenase subunit alpha [Sulfolobus sp. A20]TRM76340.1 xanthine dehydrogenase family protein molybdopterin-binding subunit [Sulfolobus sp. E5]TRM76960.1 xanthine dehydrogenase family protein molybdopterin-binding subunit [Sulfolobus sp. B5]TRM81202.1 xanthine dehydrogenase family protein molybdopterin-binding subunit [Sulfolobus sp. D5]TRM83302.1 xanthine dehydrogenase family protein molybdopterin-binding subunit [Sulfolobus sp. A20-N-F6]TRM89755.1 xanthine dehydrogenase 